MLNIIRLGENAKHDDTFFVDRPHGHPVLLLLLVKTSAKFFVDSEWVETSPGTAVIFREGQRHLYGSSDSCREFPAYTDDWMHMEPPVSVLPAHFPYGQPVLLHNPEEFYCLFHMIHTEFYGANPHKKRIIDHLATTLLYKIENESNTKEHPDIYYRLVALREEIYRNPQTEWSIPEIADSLHISEGYFHSIYRHFFHTTCISDVICSRIQTACELLSATNKPIERIGELCGYHNTEHFIRQFKKQMGNTPARYRKTIG